MAYKYEKTIKEELEFTDLDNTDNQDKMLKELQEVYNKAKAFDAIVDIEDDFVKYHGFSPCVEEYAEEVEEIISEYMERADDER